MQASYPRACACPLPQPRALLLQQFFPAPPPHVPTTPIPSQALVDQTDKKMGLSRAEAEDRLVKYGYNELPSKEVNPLLVFLGYFWVRGLFQRGGAAFVPAQCPHVSLGAHPCLAPLPFCHTPTLRRRAPCPS